MIDVEGSNGRNLLHRHSNVTQENHEKDEMEEEVKRKPERKNSVDDFFWSRR